MKRHALATASAVAVLLCRLNRLELCTGYPEFVWTLTDREAAGLLVGFCYKCRCSGAHTVVTYGQLLLCSSHVGVLVLLLPACACVGWLVVGLLFGRLKNVVVELGSPTRARIACCV